MVSLRPTGVDFALEMAHIRSGALAWAKSNIKSLHVCFRVFHVNYLFWASLPIYTLYLNCFLYLPLYIACACLTVSYFSTSLFIYIGFKKTLSLYLLLDGMHNLWAYKNLSLNALHFSPLLKLIQFHPSFPTYFQNLFCWNSVSLGLTSVLDLNQRRLHYTLCSYLSHNV